MRAVIVSIGIFFSVGFSFTANAQSGREFQLNMGDTTYPMKRYYFCMLKRPEKVTLPDSTSLAKLQQEHVAHIFSMIRQGKFLLSGPMDDDGSLRGILVIDAATEEEARAIEAVDPMVKAGLLEMEFHPWWTIKGSCLK